VLLLTLRDEMKRLELSELRRRYGISDERRIGETEFQIDVEPGKSRVLPTVRAIKLAL